MSKDMDWKRTLVHEEWSVQWQMLGRYFIFHHEPCQEGLSVVFNEDPEKIIIKEKMYKCSICGEPVPSDIGRVAKWLVVSKKMKE